jgi:glycosyltransferase involved in cell wall biosynthesis
VSVCVPTYNDAVFLPHALNSILAQSYSRIEVVVGDNGSTDETPAVVDSFADPRIRYHRNERNLGPLGGMNACIQRSSGDLVAVYHSDDVYDTTIVEEEVAFLAAHPEAGAVFTLDRWIDAAGQVIGETHLPPGVPDTPCLSMEQVFPLLLRHKNRLLRAPTFMARRRVFAEVGLFEPDTYPMAGDLEYWLRVLTRFPVGIIRRHLMSYRQHPSQVSSQYNRLRTTQEEFFAVIDRYLSDPAVAAHADERSLIEYAFHRCDDETTRAANLVIRGDMGQARSLLARPFRWQAMVGGITRRKARVVLLRWVLRTGIAMGARRPLVSLLRVTERGFRGLPPVPGS